MFSNGPSWVSGKIDGALSFDGADDIAESSAIFTSPPSSFTLSSWIKWNTITNSTGIIGKRGTNQGFMFSGSSANRVACNVDSTSVISPSNTIAVNIWNFFTCVWDGSTISLYKNGILLNSAPASTFTNPIQNFRMGKVGGGNYFNGILDDVRIYNRALSQSEIQELYDLASVYAGSDTEPPSVPTGLTATAVSSTKIDLSWFASNDNIAVTGYKIYRDGLEIGTTTSLTYSNTGLIPETNYSYAVASYDAIGNTSFQSPTVQATTLGAGESLPMPLGSVSGVTPTSTNCPVGYSCLNFTLSCPNIVPTTGILAIGNATGLTKGVGMFLTGNDGTTFYSDYGTDINTWMQGLRDGGLQIVQVKWGNGWWNYAKNLNSGIAKLACRPATIIKYVHDNYYAPLDLGRKSFITTGNSAGSSQLTYALAFYGADSIIDVAIPSAGPPHAALQKSCGGQEGYLLTDGKRSQVDNSYGIKTGNGPCFSLSTDPSWISTWTSDATAYGGTDYYYPNTLVHQIIGEYDSATMAPAMDYRDKLISEGNPHYVWEVVPSTYHAVYSKVQGRNAIGQVINTALAE